MRALFFLLVLTLTAAAQIHPSLPEPGTLDGLGVNIHFTQPEPGELEMIRAAGFRWVRMDFSWQGTEAEPGRFDFSKYDSLVAALEKAGLRAYFILDYGHPKFADAGDRQPFTSRAGTQEFRDAFAKWAVAAVGHFKGRGIVWELWNEPNIVGFWKPKPDVQQYIALAKTVAAALEKAGLRGKSRTFPPGTKREAAGECLVGPATSLVDLPFLDACFAAGLLEVFDAISVHPYRQGAPESVAEEYRALRLLIRRHCATDALPLGTSDPSRPDPKRRIPILSGEWGYSTAWPSLGKDEAAREATQAKYLPRMFLTNIANDIPLSIWYDWRDDGDDAKEGEHRFGIVRRKPTGDAKQPFEPKPGYTAVKVMTEELKGMKFDKTFRCFPDADWLMTSAEDSFARRINPGCKHAEVQLWVGKSGHCLLSFFSGGSKAPSVIFPTDIRPRRFVTHTGKVRDVKDIQNVPPGLDTLSSTVAPEKTEEWPTWRFDVSTGVEYRFFDEAFDSTPKLVEGWKRLPLELISTARTEFAQTIQFTNLLGHKFALPGWEKSQALFNWPSNPEYRAKAYGESTVLIPPGGTMQRKHDCFIGMAPALGEEFVPLEILYGPQRLLFVQTLRTMPLNPMSARFVGATGGTEIPLEKKYTDPAELAYVKKLGMKPSREPVSLFFEVRRTDSGKLSFPFCLENWSNDVGSGRLDPGRVPVEFAGTEHKKIIEFPIGDPMYGLDVNMMMFGDLTPQFLGSSRWELEQIFTIPVSHGNVLAIPDGDAAVASTQSLADAQPAEGASISGTPSVRLSYEFADGWKFVRIEPKDAAARKIAGEPRAFGIWVHGDGNGGVPCIRIRDATGQTHQVRGEAITWKGWRYLMFPLKPAPDDGRTMIPLPDSGAEQRVSWGHWGGANDGEVHGPIEWDSLFLLDGNRRAMKGEIYLSAPTLVY